MGTGARKAKLCQQLIHLNEPSSQTEGIFKDEVADIKTEEEAFFCYKYEFSKKNYEN